MKQLFIIKADGSKTRFSYKKLLKSIQKSGASADAADRIARQVLRELPNEFTSNMLFDLIHRQLKQTNRQVAQIYSLRRALADIPPDIWEKYIAKLFEYYGYQTKWNVIIPGASVEHQVDVIVTKDKKTWLIECKHHYEYHRDTGLGEILQVQARLEDVRDGFKKNKNKYDFFGAWLVTNTRFSDHNKRYADAKKINLTGWQYPEQYSLERLIQDRAIYPVTILYTDKKTKNTLLYNNILTIQDLEKMPPQLKKILGGKLKGLNKQAADLMEYDWQI
ncbi:MAG: hypothetical protein AUJ28_03700 [Parcubacteria group bacterium CG1_02_37_51]|uniref:ATP-cone domain-containing protein n=2 Tax=Candidatus Komeiliibacteriota TaxID=1817908 RepID=A0A2M7RFW5_9BACT|nr:MAG: hypothetical protein AUJ28_03700 [Parcubacteria group bacterium CG1_02_37_51]PIY95246.1 MAG: hypothetical protein COY67_00990 [Candidatus Komeilibacteria bacterium CG_4_10_14_0_8_um_filter_37_78]